MRGPVVAFRRGPSPTDEVTSQRDGVTLTPRQHQVLRALALGMCDKVIAAELGISQRTVRLHLSLLRDRLGCATRAAAAARAVSLGLVQLPTELRPEPPSTAVVGLVKSKLIHERMQQMTGSASRIAP